jgi:hypothetical protein
LREGDHGDDPSNPGRAIELAIELGLAAHVGEFGQGRADVAVKCGIDRAEYGGVDEVGCGGGVGTGELGEAEKVGRFGVTEHLGQ